MHEDSTSGHGAWPASRGSITIHAIALATGIAVGRAVPALAALPLLVISAVVLMAATGSARGRPRLASSLTVVLFICAGVLWYPLRHPRATFAALPATADIATLVDVRGTAVGPPETVERRRGSMAAFDPRPPGSRFTLRLSSVVGADGAPRTARGTLEVRVDQTVTPFDAGDELTVTGWLLPPRPPRNPGGFDGIAYARRTGRVGVLSVPGRGLVRAVPGRSWRSALRRGRMKLVNFASARIAVSARRPERRALVEALLLGRRGDLAGLDESFRRVGLAHLLAISGLHLGVLAGTVLVLTRFSPLGRRLQGVVMIAVVLAYLALVEVRTPVLRAGIMTIAASLGLLCRRRLDLRGLIAVSAMGLLIWRPAQLFEPGFQLSYGVVLGLLSLASPVRRRWFGPPDRLAGSTGRMLLEWLKSSVAVAVVAWLVATPLTLHHYGRCSPFAAPLSVVTIPVVGVLLLSGYVQILSAPVLPSAGLLAGLVTDGSAAVLLGIVRVADTAPMSVLEVGRAPAAWSLAALVWVAWWSRRDRLARRRGVWLTGLALAGGLVVIRMVSTRHAPLQVDMLDVGDGTCLVVRSDGATVLFDAGSSTSLDAGRHTVVPALRRLGVRDIGAIVISHPNLDHYSAVPEVIDEFDVGAILVTPAFVRHARDDPAGPTAFLMAFVERRSTPVHVVVAGNRRLVGRSTWSWLHPTPGWSAGSANDGSMVIRITAADRRLLLTGDIEARAITRLLASGAELHADVMELPHHGAHTASAGDLVAAVAPSVVLQSTGRRRWRRDGWGDELHSLSRIVTARDGAGHVEIDDDGVITVKRFLGGGDGG